MPEIESEPSEIAAEDGVVVMDGPGGIAVTLTPNAAGETADRLKDAAHDARRHKPKPE